MRRPDDACTTPLPHADRRRRRRPPPSPLVTHLPTVVGAAVFAGCFLRYRQRWFIPGWPGAGYVEWVHHSTAEGTAIAPNQYRPLVPWLTAGLDAWTPLNLPQAILGLDALVFAGVFVSLVVLGRRLEAQGVPAAGAWVPLAGALSFAFWFTKLDHWHPETAPLLLLAGVVACVLARPQPPAGQVLVCGLVMLGLRTDFAATLGVAALLVGLARRSWAWAGTGLALGAAAVVASWFWVWLYPQAHYIADVVQLRYNVGTLSSWGFVLTLYVVPILLAPALLLARRSLPPLWPLLVWFAAEFGSVFVVGRVEESRIFLPFAPVLAVAAVVSYLQLRENADHRPGPAALAFVERRA